MGVFLTILVIAVLVWTICVQIGARQHAEVTAPLAEQDAAALVKNYFGLLWTLVDGPGHLNYRPKLRAHAPTLSVSFSPNGTRECGVSIWVSNGTTYYGLLVHAMLMWRKKMVLANRLRDGSAVDKNWTRGS